MSLMAAIFLSAFLTLLLVKLFRPVAFKIGLVDGPDYRKHHDGSVPLVGGIAVFCGFLFSVLTLNIPLSPWKPLFAAGALMLIVGVMDDIKEIRVRDRFIAQAGAVLLVSFWNGVSLSGLGNLLGFGDIQLSWLAIPFTIFGVVGVMNAFNMIDGMDGLSSGLSLILFAILALLSYQAGLVGDFALLSMLLACTLGFFLCNFRFTEQRRVLSFLGDGGSLFLGFAIAYFLVRHSQGEQALFRPVTALWLFAVPLMDTVAIMIRRVRRGRSAFEPDREHLHHLLQRAGFSVRRSAMLIFALQLLMSAIGLAGEYYQLPEYLMFYGFLTVFALYYGGVRQVLSSGGTPGCHDESMRAKTVSQI
jgi:UDP-GlcNAc:undecaprenyl-phosphate GlcNAc-1-phosphate transferase